jgi:hypothetical protein
MFDITNKDYIIKLSTGRVINIYYRSNSGIYYRVLDKKNKWQEPMLAIKTLSTDFDVCIDATDNIHIIAKDRPGNVVHLLFNNGNWDTGTVIKNRGINIELNNLSIICNNEEVYFFYIMKQPNKCLLSYQIHRGTGNMSEPNVIDYVEEGKVPFYVIKDEKKNIYVFYKHSDNRYNRIGYKKYSTLTDKWDNFYPIATNSGGLNLISGVVCGDDLIQVCWERVSEQNYELMYSKGQPELQSWSEETVINTAAAPFSGASILVNNDRVLVYYINGKDITYLISYDNGITWSQPEPYYFSNNKPFYCISFKTNIPDEYPNTYFRFVPGDYANGYRLALLNDSTVMNGGKMENNLKSIMVDTFKTISDNIDELKQSMVKLNEKIEELDNRANKQGWGKKTRGEDMEKAEEQETGETSEDVEELDGKDEETGKNAIESNNDKRDKPVMSGTGFKNITFDYLKNLQKGKQG